MTDPKSRIKFAPSANKRANTADEGPRPGIARRRSSVALQFLKDLVKAKEDTAALRPRRRSSAALQRLRDLISPSKEDLPGAPSQRRRSSIDALKDLKDRITPTRETFAFRRKSKEGRPTFEHTKSSASVAKLQDHVAGPKEGTPLQQQTLVVTLPGPLELGLEDAVSPATRIEAKSGAQPSDQPETKPEATKGAKKAYRVSKFTEVFEGDAGYVPRPITPPLIHSPLPLTAEPVVPAPVEPTVAAPADLAQAPSANASTASVVQTTPAPPQNVVHRMPFLDDTSERESRIDESFFGIGEWPPHLIEDWTTGNKVMVKWSGRAEAHMVDRRDPPETNPKAEKGVKMVLGVTGEDDPRRYRVKEIYFDEPQAYTADVIAAPKEDTMEWDVQPYEGT